MAQSVSSERSVRALKGSKKATSMSGADLGNKLLQSVKEMKAGKAARSTTIAGNEIAAARLRTGLSQAGPGTLHR